jgi:hypothetical protein
MSTESTNAGAYTGIAGFTCHVTGMAAYTEGTNMADARSVIAVFLFINSLY